MISVDSPSEFFTLKVFCCTGLRMSASIKSTLLPVWEKAIAMLAAVVDFPSPGLMLETAMDFLPDVPKANITFVRMDL